MAVAIATAATKKSNRVRIFALFDRIRKSPADLVNLNSCLISRKVSLFLYRMILFQYTLLDRCQSFDIMVVLINESVGALVNDVVELGDEDDRL